ncbi:hypothetical protein C8Q74DRAFT_1223214 [Fomes fomentarius]|nr:hypothetical protein C8Q74DRAFT_1223214 [Fomes fomentarius]
MYQASQSIVADASLDYLYMSVCLVVCPTGSRFVQGQQKGMTEDSHCNIERWIATHKICVMQVTCTEEMTMNQTHKISWYRKGKLCLTSPISQCRDFCAEKNGPSCCVEHLICISEHVDIRPARRSPQTYAQYMHSIHSAENIWMDEPCDYPYVAWERVCWQVCLGNEGTNLMTECLRTWRKYSSITKRIIHHISVILLQLLYLHCTTTTSISGNRGGK